MNKKWCPVCGKFTDHKKFSGKTTLLVYSGELVDGVPVQPKIKQTESDTGCPYWKGQCSIHQGDRHFEMSPEFNTGQPVRRVPTNLTSQSCRPPREGEIVCCECLEAAESGVTVMDLQKELKCDRRSIYGRSSRRNIGKRYVSDTGHRPERRFTQGEAEIVRTNGLVVPESEAPPAEDKPVHCECCGTRLG